MKKLQKLVATSSIIAMGALFSQVASAAETDLAGVAGTASKNVFAIMELLFAGSSVIGFGMCIIGLLLLRKNQQQPNQEHGKNGVITLVIGVALLAIVFIIKVITGSIGADEDDASGRLDSTGWTGSST